MVLLYIVAGVLLLLGVASTLIEEENARKHVVDHFSFESIGKALADHYSNIVEQKRKKTCVE